ncbi:hypothetical protein LFM09_16385 [Lentzea alba]|uniref:hypothetical protein n=1 Tax=Lentzea alba TaxID=2714351 RepID=UPI0039BF2D28
MNHAVPAAELHGLRELVTGTTDTRQSQNSSQVQRGGRTGAHSSKPPSTAAIERTNSILSAA